MSLPTHDDADWLRSELDGLLAGEPTMPTAAVADDVRRGMVSVRHARRRTAAIAVAAVLVAVAVPVGLLVRPSSDAAAPVGPSEVPDVPGVSQQWLDSISPALAAQTGWVVDWKDSVVYGDVATGLQLDLQIVAGTQVSQDPPRFAVPSPPYAETAGLHLWFAPKGKAPGAALAECPAERCARDLPDRKFPAYLDQAATAGNGTSLAAGTLIVDRSYDDGRFVELVAVPVALAPSGPADQTARNVLTYPLAGAFLDALGTPPTTSSASPSPSSKEGSGYVAEAQWASAAAALLPGKVTVLDDSPAAQPTRLIRGFRVERNGVGTFVHIDIEAFVDPSANVVPPASYDPCSGGDRCSVLLGWSPMTLHGGTALLSVIERTSPGDPTARAGYHGPNVIRSLIVHEGSTVVVVSSDSRDIDASGAWLSSSSPGLGTDELVSLASALPLPVRFRAAVDAHWAPAASGIGSGSANPMPVG